MSFSTYLLASIVLSWVGILVYLGFRAVGLSPAHRRGLLWLVIGLSFTLPLTTGIYKSEDQLAEIDKLKAASARFLPGHNHDTHGLQDASLHAAGIFSSAFGAVRHPESGASSGTHELMPAEGGHASHPPIGFAELRLHFGKRARGVNEFCQCQDPGPKEVLMYHSHLVYEFVLENRRGLDLVFLVLAAMVFLWWLIQIVHLHRNLRTAKGEWVRFRNKRIYKVESWKGNAAGSLWFGRPYLFWHSALDDLSANEQEAVLLHELAHLRQRNTLEKLIINTLRAFWLINPVWYFINRELELISEYMADSWTVRQTRNKKAYAYLLLRIKTDPQMSLLSFFGGSGLKPRIKHLTRPQSMPARGIRFFFLLAFVGLLSGEMYTRNLIQQQLFDLEVYAYMTRSHERTGKKEFCQKCTMEAVAEGQECYVE